MGKHSGSECGQISVNPLNAACIPSLVSFRRHLTLFFPHVLERVDSSRQSENRTRNAGPVYECNDLSSASERRSEMLGD